MNARRLKRILQKPIVMFFNKVMGSGLAQEENDASGERYITPGMPDQIRRMAEEGIVLLKNENRTLPIRDGQTVSVFGRVQHDWFYVGYGSGGDVHPPYTVSFFDGLKNAGIRCNENLKAIYDAWCAHPDNEAEQGYWGHWPYYQEEMPLSAQLVEQARAESDVALVIIGRAAGEDRENKLEPGSFYLTAKERKMLELVTAAFPKTVLLLDCGNIIDLSFTAEYKLDAIVYAWQLGQENANAVGNVLAGVVNPSGKLPDTIAKRYEDYPSSGNFGGKDCNSYAEDIYVGYRYFTTFAPDRVLYPFGFGLSYTDFSLNPGSIAMEPDGVRFAVSVTNTGSAAGKQVVQLYAAAPDGLLGKPAKVLVGYAKTRLLQPGESQTVEISVRETDYASYDDSGVTGHKDCFLLEPGCYRFYCGTDCMTDREVFRYQLEQTKVLQQCREICTPDGANSFLLANPVGSRTVAVAAGGLKVPASRLYAGSRDLRRRIVENLPAEILPTGNRGIRLEDVKQGKATMDAFVAQLTDDQLVDLTRGEGMMNSPLGTPGNAGAFGGITQSLRDLGIPALITADGPAGLRVKKFTTLLPCGSAIASAWNPELVEQTLTLVGQEAVHFGIDVNLAPGMNIHRNMLCGRNFEYYSEDPMLSGRTAAAAVRGLQSGGTAACPKHFACNNQEVNRNHNDSRVSVRALREIYLKNFEYCVKEGKPLTLMTSYNKINGVWSHYNYDLVTTVLRQEWGFTGTVVTDWWMQKSVSPEFPALKDNAYRTRAQVDVLMPGGISPTQQKYVFDKEHLASLSVPDGLTRAELQRIAKNVLTFALTRM